ncbi:FAD-binding protein, partial [Patulibacter sp. NPDC049589]|uniref:FAD-binding protein n=1 Tax=Patulibacter sp. NPDC049589 TaxID=3154731 RepID=UPI00342C511F
ARNFSLEPGTEWQVRRGRSGRGEREPEGALMLLRTGLLQGVAVDAERRVARVAAGTTAAALSAAAAEHGLAANVGMAAGVGVVGSLLGGGLGWLSRRLGLGAADVLAVELVTADGGLVRVQAGEADDLLWALRGGGIPLGVVVALEVRLHPAPTVHAGALFWPVERGAEVLRAWRDWCDGVPDDVTSVGRLLWVPAFPEIPAPLRGRAFVVVEAACLLDDGRASGVLAPLRALGPEIDTFARIPAPALAALHMDPPEPVPAVLDHLLLDELTDEAIDAVVAVAGPPVISLELRQLGGALRTPTGADGAQCGLDGAFLANAVAILPGPEAAGVARQAIGRVTGALGPWDTGRRFTNFVDRPGSTAPTLATETAVRLRAVRAAWDPTGLFVSAHAPARD